MLLLFLLSFSFPSQKSLYSFGFIIFLYVIQGVLFLLSAKAVWIHLFWRLQSAILSLTLINDVKFVCLFENKFISIQHWVLCPAKYLMLALKVSWIQTSFHSFTFASNIFTARFESFKLLPILLHFPNVCICISKRWKICRRSGGKWGQRTASSSFSLQSFSWILSLNIFLTKFL